MPLKLEIKRKLSARSDRVKSVDIHPSEPWMLVSLYNGNVHVWNHESQQLVKSFEVCEPPVRTAKFVARKNWIITGSDDFQIRAFNYNTLERAHAFEAHSDYIRSIAVHPTQPYLLSSSDDMTIKLWDWDNKWQCKQTFEGHSHYVMQIVFNPKDSNTFASASLDKTIKVWQLGSAHPNFTLEGHEKGVNCVDYYHGGDKPYLVSGADDRLVKLWDYQNKNCVQTLEGHTQNISCVAFHTELPLIITGSEDGTVKLWHSNTYRLDNTLNYGLERVWAISCLKGSNNVAIGYDEGSVMIKLGREEPAISMDSSGKIIWAKHSEIQQANLRALGDAESIKDGEKLPLTIKDMGACDIYPQTISHNPNGRFVVACGDGEYIIYTSMALRNKAYGSAQEFIWSFDSSEYAIRDGNQIKIFKNFKERKSFKPSFGTESIYGGNLLGVKSVSGLSFFDWESTDLIRRIEITPKLLFWSENGEQVAIACEDSFYVLKYNAEAVATARQNPAELITEDGIEDAFTVLNEVNESVRTGIWIGDCFIYTNSLNRLNYYVGGEICTISHLDRQMYLLGYIPADNRVYLSDKDLNVVSFSLLLSVLEYQTAVMRKDFDTADRVLPTIPRDQCSRVAHFLEKQGFKQQALAVTNDPEHKFDLALQLGDLRVAYQIAKDTESEQKWKLLSDVASKKCQFNLAQDCLQKADDFGSLVLLASSNGNADLMGQVAESSKSKGQNNLSFLSYFVLGKLEECLQLLIDTNRLPEAAFFARTYLPSQISRVVKLWKEELKKTSEKAAQALADPTEYENLFSGYQDLLKAEQFLGPERAKPIHAKQYPQVIPNHTRKPVDEMLSAEESSEFFYDASKIAPTVVQKLSTSGENEDEFADAEGAESSKEESIASLARKIQETKLNQQETPTPTTFTPPVQSVPQPPPQQAQRQASSQPSADDDLDLDIDAELENVDTSDVNLNDDLSDD